MEYRVSIKETNLGYIIVDVKNKEEAIIKAEKAYRNGAVQWQDRSVESTGVSEEQELKNEYGIIIC